MVNEIELGCTSDVENLKRLSPWNRNSTREERARRAWLKLVTKQRDTVQPTTVLFSYTTPRDRDKGKGLLMRASVLLAEPMLRLEDGLAHQRAQSLGTREDMSK